VFDRPAFILRTDAVESGTGHYDRLIVEIASDVKLWDEYGLSDGDEIEIDVLE
jgi:CTP-dependent riboflavin kinase